MIIYQGKYRIDFDELTDTLYISIGESIVSTDSELDTDYILVRYYHDTIIGIIIFDYIERHYEGSWDDRLITQYFSDFPIPINIPIKVYPYENSVKIQRLL